jgi:hypothetical protein
MSPYIIHRKPCLANLAPDWPCEGGGGGTQLIIRQISSWILSGTPPLQKPIKSFCQGNAQSCSISAIRVSYHLYRRLCDYLEFDSCKDFIICKRRVKRWVVLKSIWLCQKLSLYWDQG